MSTIEYFTDGAEMLSYRLVKTTKRLTFDIIYQSPALTFDGADDEDYYMFIASNGYQVMSRSRLDIQTERIWLRGGTNDDIANRSGTMVFSSNEKRDKAFDGFNLAIKEFVAYYLDNEYHRRLSDYAQNIR